MYKDYFGLDHKPFSIAPDPRYLYMSQRHREALAHLLFGVGEGGGFVQLTGEVGTGKTTVCRCLLEQLPDNVDVALILNPKLSAEELVASICDELKIEYPQDRPTMKQLIDALNGHLLATHAKGRRMVLIIDEAQNLSTEVLEQVRLLTNLETAEEKLLQIILIGQPELNELLSLHKLRQLAQRVTARYHLDALNRVETADYIEHRLRISGVTQPLFAKGALDEIHRLSGGIPRLINILCDRALLGAYVENKPTVDVRVLHKAAHEVGVRKTRDGKRFNPRWFGIAAAVLAAAGLGWWLVSDRPSPEAGASVQTETGAANENVVAKKAAQPIAAKPDDAPVAATAPVAAPHNNEWTPDRKSPAKSKSSAETPVSAMMVGDLSGANEQAAASHLLGAWGLKIPGGDDLCQAAQARQLKCVAGQASWGTLRRTDRPAILYLKPGEGETAPVMLEALSDQRATVIVGSVRRTLPISEIDRIWDGQYTTLWRPPITSKVLRPGESGEDVGWLRQTLGKLLGSPVPSSDPFLFDEGLRDQVKQFQRISGLEEDGVVGRQTLLQINSAVAGDHIPRLSRKQS